MSDISADHSSDKSYFTDQDDTEVALLKKARVGMSAAFETGQYADLTVQCGDQIWKEGLSRVIKLEEDDPTMVKQMLESFYSCDYDDSAHSTQSDFEFNAGMYTLADKYGIEDLKELSKHKFWSLMVYFMPSQSRIPQLVEAIKVVYTTTLSSDRGLRDMIVPVCKKHRDALRNNRDYMQLLKSGLGEGDFVTDVVDALMELGQPRKYRCLTCEHDDYEDFIEEAIKCSQCENTISFLLGPELHM